MNAGEHSPKLNLMTSKFEMKFRRLPFALCLIFLALGCDRGQEELTPTNDENPEQILQQFSTKHTESGVTKWTLIADSGEFMESVVYVQNPTVQIFEDGQITLTVTGDRGEIIESNNNLKIFDNVVGISQNGVLYTDELHWHNRNGKLYAPNESEIVRGDSTMVGREMESRPSLEVVTMKHVRFNFYAKDEKVGATEPVVENEIPHSKGITNAGTR